ncbi:MAG: class I SAM-dependent methyltransferase [Planctomycetota bacterium]
MSQSSPSNAEIQIELHRALAPRYAYRYSFEFSRLFQSDWHAELMSHAPPGTRRVLDLGCGTGFFLADLDARHPGAVGLDISHEMLKVSERYVPRARVVTGDAEKLPFRPGAFDAVFCKGSLHHTRDHVGFLENCRRTLGGQGVLVMSEPCNDNPLIRFARWLLYRVSPHFHADDRGFTRGEIVGVCEKAGFEVVTVKRYGVFAYALAGFPDHLPLMRWIPGSAAITRMMIKIDRMMCATPGLSLFGFHVIVVGRPRGRPI